MVAAVVVMMISSQVSPVASVPNVRKLRHCFRLLFVYFLQKFRVYRFAVAVHSHCVKVQGFRQQAFVACHYVCKVSQGFRCVSLCSDVNVNSAPSCGVALCSGSAEKPYKLLQSFHILVVENRCHKLAFFIVGACNAYVLLELPFSALSVPS